MINHRDKSNFRDEIIGDDLLINAIDWIKSNLSISDVFDNEDIADYASENFSVGEIFGDNEIIEYVKNNYSPLNVFPIEDITSIYRDEQISIIVDEKG